jgi:hypothetical protein
MYQKLSGRGHSMYEGEQKPGCRKPKTQIFFRFAFNGEGFFGI